MSPRTITTEAVGSSEAPPEVATVKARISGDSDTLSGARGLVTDRAETLRESITTVASDRVRTVDLQVQHRDELFDPPGDAEYYAKAHIHIDCLPEQAGTVSEEVTAAGGQIRSIDFQLHDETHQRLQEAALEQAMARAREKAAVMAAAEEETIAGVQEARSADSSTDMNSVLDEAISSDFDTELHPAPISISERVTVVYELTAA